MPITETARHITVAEQFFSFLHAELSFADDAHMPMQDSLVQSLKTGIFKVILGLAQAGRLDSSGVYSAQYAIDPAVRLDFQATNNGHAGIRTPALNTPLRWVVERDVRGRKPDLIAVTIRGEMAHMLGTVAGSSQLDPIPDYDQLVEASIQIGDFLTPDSGIRQIT